MSIRRVLVFGFSRFKTQKNEYFEIHFGDKSLSENIANFDIIIYIVGSFNYEYTLGAFHQNVRLDANREAIRRENEIRQALEKGNIVCFIGSHGDDYVFSRILNSYDVWFGPITNDRRMFSDIQIRRSEFKTFLENVGATSIKFNAKSLDEIICNVSVHNVSGFSKHIEKGLLISLPCLWGSDKVGYIIGILETLTNGVISYSSKLMFEPPKWISNFLFSSEKELSDRIEKIKTEKLMPLELKLNKYSRLKSIFWLGNNKLVEAVNEFLKNMGFTTEIDEIYEEDIWILDEKKKRIIIEVKGKNKNLPRSDISKLDEHREARQVPNMTALLIANTFMTANSIDAKQEPFSRNVIEKAINTNVIITRTIDLCMIYDIMENSNITIKDIMNIMIDKKGWLTVKNNEVIITS